MAAGPVLMGLAAGASVVQGIMGYSAANKEARLIERQGQLEQEAANDEAARHAKEVRRFAAKQKLAFLKNGVQLDGTPLDVLDETFTEGQKEVDATVRRGVETANLRRGQAANTRAKGRAALVGGLGSAVGMYSLYGAKSSTGAAKGYSGIGDVSDYYPY